MLIIQLRNWKSTLALGAQICDLAVICLFKDRLNFFLLVTGWVPVNVILTLVLCRPLGHLMFLAHPLNPVCIVASHIINDVLTSERKCAREADFPSLILWFSLKGRGYSLHIPALVLSVLRFLRAKVEVSLWLVKTLLARWAVPFLRSLKGSLLDGLRSVRHCDYVLLVFLWYQLSCKGFVNSYVWLRCDQLDIVLAFKIWAAHGIIFVYLI